MNIDNKGTDTAINDQNNNDNNDEDDVLLQVVLSQLRSMAQQAGYINHGLHPHPRGDEAEDSNTDDRNDDQEGAIQIDKVRIALEATGGDVELAASLYWDDYLATRMAAVAAKDDNAQPRRLDMPIRPQEQSTSATGAAENKNNEECEADRDNASAQRYRRRRSRPEVDECSDTAAVRNQNLDQMNEELDAVIANAGVPVRGMAASRTAAAAAAAASRRLARRLDRDFDRQMLMQQRALLPGQVGGLQFLQQPQVPAVARQAQGAMGRAFAAAGGAAGAAGEAAAVVVQAAAIADAIAVPNNNNQGLANDNGGRVARLMAQAREAARQLEHPQQVLAARAFLAGESVSVSDDESGGVWKMVGDIAAAASALEEDDDDDNDNGEKNAERNRDTCLPRHKRRKIAKDQGDKIDTDIYVDGYMSDNDWIWESLSEQGHLNSLHAPTDFLWGIAMPAAEQSSSSTDVADRPPAAAAVAAGSRSSILIADDDVDDPEGGEGAVVTEKSGIPRTWLSAGFHLSPCTTGLILKPPTNDDLAYFMWQRQASGRAVSRNALPLPYHCRAISAILSIVTALLYADVSVHGRDISCTTSKNPFAELGDEERKREFESRLADALSALLLIAAKASTMLKRNAFKKHEMSNDIKEKRMWQSLNRKLHLCPTCSWEIDSTTGEMRIPEGRDADRMIKISTSYTNIQDLKSYVLSNMKAFTSTGGVALFLETIMSIHGKNAVARMVRQARHKINSTDTGKAMILCTCEEQHKKMLEANPTLSTGSSSHRNSNTIDTTPQGHDCISIELISLLLTGRVHSSLQDWSSGSLGVGLLSNVPGQVGKGLTRPDKPIWLLRGPTCYSVLWLDGSTIRDDAAQFSKKNRPGVVVKLKHWNCWYGQRNKTELRLIQYSPGWKQPILEAKLCTKKVSAVSNEDPKTTQGGMECESIDKTKYNKTMSLILERRKANIVAAEENEGIEPLDPDQIVTSEELLRLVANPEDQKFYPDKYTMWRYDFDDTLLSTQVDASSTKDQKVRAHQWRPFHKLSDREKLLVETKLGPKIKSILWTRWPRATIDKSVPEFPPPIV